MTILISTATQPLSTLALRTHGHACLLISASAVVFVIVFMLYFVGSLQAKKINHTGKNCLQFVVCFCL